MTNKTTKVSVKRALRERLEATANAYLAALLDMWGLSAKGGYWIGDDVGDTYAHGDSIYISMRSIIYCVENDVAMVEYENMQSYCCMAADFDLDMPTIETWHSGKFRRMAPEALERLQTMKTDLMKAVEEEKAKMNQY